MIITCHDQHPYLLQLLSLLDEYKEEMQNNEVIVVDSSSEPVILKDGIAYYRIPNNGPSAARNYGASIATKEWIHFCDADDIVNPYSLEVKIPGDFDVVFFKWQKFDDKNIVEQARHFFTGHLHGDINIEQLNDPVFFVQKFFPVHAVLLKRALFQQVHFNETQWFIEDVRFYLELALIPGARLGLCNNDAYTSFHRYFTDRISLSASNNQRFWEGVCGNYNYLYAKGNLSPGQKLAMVKLLLLSYHSVEPDTQAMLEKQCSSIWNSFAGIGKLLKNKLLFRMATAITRSF